MNKKQSTVLVLGAGASKEYGYPLGSDLRNEILTCKVMGKGLLRLGFSPERVNEFRRAFWYGQQYSIDAFMELRPEYEDIARSAIAMALISKEKKSAHGPIDGWYQYLFSRLTESGKEIASQNVAVITFNYDRSLEFYLWRTLQYCYGISAEEAAALVRRMEIIHVYGDLGTLPELVPGDHARPYGRYTQDDVKISAARIKVMHERDGASAEFHRARELLSAAARVAYFGFSFHKTNLERLMPKPMNRRIFVPNIGVDAPLRKRLFDKGLEVIWGDQGSSIQDCLRDWGFP